MNVISESGVYTLAFRSGKPEARRFGHWVSEKVLPVIYKARCYETTGIPPASAPEGAQALPRGLPVKGRFIITRVPGTPNLAWATSLLTMFSKMLVMLNIFREALHG